MTAPDRSEGEPIRDQTMTKHKESHMDTPASSDGVATAGQNELSPAAKDRARRISKAMCECVHFTGVQHDTCKAGVTYRDVSDKTRTPYGFPCLQVHVTTCQKRQHPTLEEATAEIDDWDRAFKRVNTALKAIRAKHGKERGLRGDMPCPNDCGGTLRYSISGYNGHVHGACSTEGCCQWMQ